ncbi:hypothetical protein ADK41_23560 [Streptomyces caelestis]|uniref:Uncharacterized protein n=1 Tax=Streptomyces caelestis TaxID=36816 RepID=A0A0M8QGN4_9ACTN|nr:hypothetical protein ADK41_23560 [Streptomyces caelestis]KOV32806.1 hypothetical protein ADK58_05810 [Streptomyces sp. XY152]
MTAGDDRSGRVVRVAVLAAEGVAQGVDGVPLESESYVGIDAGGDADVGVAQKLLEHHEVDALFQEQGGGRMSKVVETDAAESGPVEEATEATGEVGRVDRGP